MLTTTSLIIIQVVGSYGFVTFFYVFMNECFIMKSYIYEIKTLTIIRLRSDDINLNLVFYFIFINKKFTLK